MQRERQNNIELCRVCVMLFIVIHHCIVSGLGLNETLNDGGENFSSATICLIIMNAFVIVSVNVFFLISGYFGIKLRTQKIKKLLEEVLFYSVAIYAVCVLLGAEKLTLKNILKYTILSINNYWFVIVYLALMFISPALNYAVDYLKENNCEVQGLGIMFFCLCVYGYVFSNGFSEYIGINNGYSLIFASFLYITGRVINEKEAVIKKRMDFSRSAIGYITSSIIISASFFLQALSLTQGMRSTEETSLSMPYHGRRRRCILTVARGGVPRWPAAFSFAARGSFRSRPPQVLSPPACCGMGSFLLALSSHLLSDVDYTERDPKCKGLSHFNAIK